MNADHIRRLCRFIPADEVNLSRNHYWRMTGVQTDDADPDLDRFIMAYKDLGFGWHFVKMLVDNRLPFPACAYTNESRFLWRSYLYLLNKQRHRDPAVLEAVALTRNDPSCAYKRTVINALLMVEDIEYPAIAKALRKSISPEGVEAYATCFYDIAGRKEDLALLASIVYPHGRYAEFVKDSFDSEAFSQLLLRAGFNNGVDDVLAMAGIRTDYMSRCQTTDAAKRLETLIMSLGFLVARNGGIASTGPALYNARSLIAAAKQGGNEGVTSPFNGSMGRKMIDELEKMAAGFSMETNSRTLFGGAGAGIEMTDLAAVRTIVSGSTT